MLPKLRFLLGETIGLAIYRTKQPPLCSLPPSSRLLHEYCLLTKQFGLQDNNTTADNGRCLNSVLAGMQLINSKLANANVKLGNNSWKF